MIALLLWTKRILYISAALCLGYAAWFFADAWIFEAWESRNLEAFAPVSAPADGGTSNPLVSALDTGVIALMQIPRLDVSVVVIEGISGKTLRRGVGHIPGMALPGEPGNIGIAGHRDTFFRPLRNIRTGDVIELDTLLEAFRYRVVSTQVVAPSASDVLEPTSAEVLTLVTCYPFYYVGPAPDRFIIRAERVRS